MNREVLILDVTAMSGDNVCVAGVDVTSGDTIRLNSPQLAAANTPPGRELR